MARILILTQDPRLGGGVLRHVEAVVEVLRAKGHKLALASIATSRADPLSTRLLAPTTWLRGPRSERSTYELVSGPIDWTHHGGSFAELGWLRYRPRRSVDALLPDCDLVVVCAGSAQYGGVLDRCRLPLIVTVATAISNERTRTAHRLGRRALHWLWNLTDSRTELRTLARADVVLAQSPRSAIELAQRSGRSVETAPLGYWPTSPVASSRPRAHFLCVARAADPRKRLDVLFEAIRLANHLGPIAPVVLVSQDPIPKGLQAQAGDLQNVGWLRVEINLDQATLADRYDTAIALVHTADQEGLGLTVLEAFAHGTPVIVTRCGAPEDIVRDGIDGRLVERRNAHAVASAMRTFDADRATSERMGAAGRESIATTWSPENGRSILREAVQTCLGTSGDE